MMEEPCDYGWFHLCGGPHVVSEGDDRQAVPFPGPDEDECRTVRCGTHCSCFFPDYVHDPECALAVNDG